ncbi:MAG: hypothetical protein LBQ83_05875 [Candidatus Margulisbacteria bacterium]|jgi:hypothetical protein|nr:hypothetical protein [Candidatus Margulisiibacteriota bacterium]
MNRKLIELNEAFTELQATASSVPFPTLEDQGIYIDRSFNEGDSIFIQNQIIFKPVKIGDSIFVPKEAKDVYGIQDRFGRNIKFYNFNRLLPEGLDAIFYDTYKIPLNLSDTFSIAGYTFVIIRQIIKLIKFFIPSVIPSTALYNGLATGSLLGATLLLGIGLGINTIYSQKRDTIFDRYSDYQAKLNLEKPKVERTEE